MKPLVSISIAVWNGLSETKVCLEALSKISYKNIEIIVVDNGSTDQTVSFIKKNYPKINLYQNHKNLGFTGGHNRSVTLSKGKYLLLLNNDIKVNKNFLEPLVSDLEKDLKVAAVQSKTFLSKDLLDNIGSSLTPIGFLKHYGFKEKDRNEYNKPRQVFSPKAACILLRKNVVDKIGLFDEDYFAYFEETDWAWRAYLSGYKIIFEPKSIVFHGLGKTSQRLPYEIVNYHSFKNRIRTILKNTSGTTLLKMLPLHLLVVNGLAVSFLIQGKKLIFLSILKAQFWNLSHLLETYKMRSIIQLNRQISDKELFVFGMDKMDFGSGLKQYLQIRKNIK